MAPTPARTQFLCLLILTLSTAAPIKAQPPTQGLVAHYSFDGHANDVSGNQLHATATATTPTLDRDGKAAGALAFDGATSFVDAGNPAQFNFASSFTIAAWVRLAGNQINKYIIAKYDFGGSTHSYGLGTSGNSQPYAFVMGEGPFYQDISGPPAMNDDEWHALAMVYNVDVGLILYFDSREMDRHPAAAGHPPFTNNVPLMIGRTFSGQFFAGAIDDVRIYNRALSAAEVVTLGPAVPPPEITITQQPRSYRISVGSQGTLQVAAQVTPFEQPVIQWFKNGEPIPGATSASLLVASEPPGQYNYKARVTAGATEKFSNEATVTFLPPPDAKLLLHYTFDNDTGNVITDSAGNFHGEATNTRRIAGRIGGSALRFDGNAFVRVPYPASELDLVGTPYTIAFWMKADSVIAPQAIVSMHDPTPGGGYGFQFLSPQSFTWVHFPEAPRTAPFRPGTNWAHVAMVWDGTGRSLFLDGVLTNRGTTTRPIASQGDDDLFLGAIKGASMFYRGALDDLRIYTYALASDEIQALATAAPSTPISITARPSDLLITWPFETIQNFRVEYTDSLGPDAVWKPASGAPTREGSIISLVQPLPTGSRFYRLRRL